MISFYRYPIDNGGALISGTFGQMYDRGGGVYAHRGVDFACPSGTPVYAPCPGVDVWFANPSNDFGIAVNLRMPNGMFCLLAHLSARTVLEGQVVETGQLVGYSGNTGVSFGPHLHWQYCLSPYYPVDISQSRDPLLELDENMMSPEERQRLENLEWIFGGPAKVAQDRMMGINYPLQIDQQNTAIFTRINQHLMQSHPGTPLIMP